MMPPPPVPNPCCVPDCWTQGSPALHGVLQTATDTGVRLEIRDCDGTVQSMASLNTPSVLSNGDKVNTYAGVPGAGCRVPSTSAAKGKAFAITGAKHCSLACAPSSICSRSRAHTCKLDGCDVVKMYAEGQTDNLE